MQITDQNCIVWCDGGNLATISTCNDLNRFFYDKLIYVALTTLYSTRGTMQLEIDVVS